MGDFRSQGPSEVILDYLVSNVEMFDVWGSVRVSFVQSAGSPQTYLDDRFSARNLPVLLTFP